MQTRRPAGTDRKRYGYDLTHSQPLDQPRRRAKASRHHSKHAPRSPIFKTSSRSSPSSSSDHLKKLCKSGHGTFCCRGTPGSGVLTIHARNVFQKSNDILMFRISKVCWSPLQSGQNLRGPHVARQQQTSIDICCPPQTSAANPPAAAVAFDRRDRRTDRRTLDRFTMLTASCADRVITQSKMNTVRRPTAHDKIK